MPSRKETPIQARKSARESTLTPLYAMAGLTDALAETARNKLNETHERAEGLQSRARQNADDLAKFIADLPAQLKALPQTTRDRAAQLSEQATSYRDEAATRYENLAGRGKRRVDEAVTTAEKLSGRAKKKTEEGLKDADPLFEGVQEAATRLRKNATGRTATDTVTPKRTSHQNTATKTTATKKTTAKKAPAKKTPAKKTTAKKSANA